MSDRPYRVGEVVLMNRGGWLKAYKVVKVHSEMQGTVETVEYTLQMVERDQWQRPAYG